MLIVQSFRGMAVPPEATILDVALQLVWIGSTDASCLAIGPTPTSERADPRASLVADDIVGIVAVQRATIGIDEARQSKPGAQLDQDILKRTDIAIRLQHWLPDRIRRPIGTADWTVKQRNAIPAFKVRGVGKHQIRIGDHLGEI